MGEQPSKDLWSVVFSGGRAYVGKILDSNPTSATLDPCYEISVHMMPSKGPNGQTVFSKNISAEPVLLSFVGSPVRLMVTGLILGDEMKPQDQARYKRLAETAAQMATAARAADAGIVTAGG